MEQYLKIGQWAAAHGVDGMLVLQHNFGKRSDFAGVEALFVETSPGRFLPYFIAQAQAKTTTESLIKLEDVNTREKALALLKKPVWLDTQQARKLSAKNAPIALVGYTVFDAKRELGPVIEVIEQPNQLLLRLELEGKEIYAPVHEASLQGIDHKKQQIHLQLPEGLLDIYLK
jgi:16S rRNA processing protein RimM